MHAQAYTCRWQSAGMYRSFLLNESSPSRCPSHSRRWIFTWGSEDCTISYYPLRVHLCNFPSLSNYYYVYYIALYLGCTPADRFILFPVVIFIFYFLRIFVSIRLLARFMKLVPLSTRLLPFGRSFMLLFRVAISTNLMI